MDASEIQLCSTISSKALSSEMSLTPTPQTPPATATTPRTTTHTPREIPTMYILDQMYDDYMDQYNGNNIATPTEIPSETNDSVQLAPCPICARTFNPLTLRKHVGICEKMATKKRNIFDSSRQRREGTELETYPLPKNFGLPEKTASSTSIARGERGHSPKPAQISSPLLTRKKPVEGLIRSTARASMRKVTACTTPTATNTTASTPSSNFTRDRMRSSERSLTRRGIQPPPAEQCPHCERCFGIKAYDRHVEWCKEKALQAAIKQGSTKTDDNVAKARWEARTKYRAPCLKTKRSMNREKYSGLAGEENEADDSQKHSKCSNKTQDNTLMSMSMTSSITSERKITNSTGNINEPSSKTAVKTPATATAANHKRIRDKSKTPQPPPTTKKTMTSTEHTQEPIINFEFEIQDFHLMGKQMATAAINKKPKDKTTNIKSISSTVSKSKPQQMVTRKRDQIFETTDVKTNLPTASLLTQVNTPSDLSLKSIRTIHINDSYNSYNSNDGDDNHHSDNDYDGIKYKEKFASARNVDLSTSLTLYASPKKTTKKEVIKTKIINKSVNKIDNKAKEKSAESIKTTMEQCFNINDITESKHPKPKTRSLAHNKEKVVENSKYIHNIKDNYNPGNADSLDILGSKKIIKLRNDGERVERKTAKVIKQTSREDPHEENEDLSLYSENIINNFVNTPKELIMKKSYHNDRDTNMEDSDNVEIDNLHHDILALIPKITIPKSQLRSQSKNPKNLSDKDCEILSPAEILTKTKKLIKSKSIEEISKGKILKCKDLLRSQFNQIYIETKIEEPRRELEELSENGYKSNSRSQTSKKQHLICQDLYNSNENISEIEIYQDCLIEADEFRLANLKNSLKGSRESLNDSFEAISKSARGRLIERNDKYFSIPSSTKSDTFILEMDQKRTEKNQHFKKSHPIPKATNLSPPALSKTYNRNDTPRSPKSFRPSRSSTPTPQFSLLPAPSITPSTQPFTSKSRFQNIQTKLESNSIKSLSICRPKRKRDLRQTVSCLSELPMRAMPLVKDSIEVCCVSSAPHINSSNEQCMNSNDKDDGDEENVEEEEDMIGEGGMENTCTIMDKEIKVFKEPPQMKRNKSFTVSGLPDNYDPFLSAKRQLEELCSPTTSDSVAIPQTTPQKPQVPSLPATPNLNKMSTSLTLSSSTPNTTPSPMTTSQMPQQITPKTPTMVRSSSFRRTASLRGPRRSPLLSTRPPLFAQKQRPTIQRGLSDEGPISTNFLKPEEYDEIPVRSVCVNDFAITKSPRVVRRDTSGLNRKQQPTLKLNINAANVNGGTSATVTPNVTEPDIVPINTASKYVSKTDSLAAFLKYEHELDKINNSAVGQEYKKEQLEDIKEPTTSSPSEITTPLSNLDGPLNAKELKDKSNNLSKQNSAKNIKADILDLTESQENSDYTLNTPSTTAKQNPEIECSNYGQVRLQPLASKPTTPLTKLLTKPTTPIIAVTKPSTPQLLPTLTHLNVNNMHQPLEYTKTPQSPKSVALSSIFSSDRSTKQPTHSSLLYAERKNSLGSDYIDPKLINKCDNLPINLNLKRSDFKHSDSDTSEPRMEHFSSSSSESSAPTKKSTSLAQNSKFLPLVKQQQQEHNNLNNLNQNHTTHQHNAPSILNSQRNSAEGRNLLKRRMRLGRNQFLYDASPEGDSCSADDEANRSSIECDNHNFMKEHEKTFERLSAAQMNTIDAPFIPPLPAFDDFDFEEFLSSFENEEEQFPLFKDCREFLLNRTSKKQRSMLMTNSNSLLNNNNSTNLKKSSPQTFPPLTPQAQSTPIQQHFQFPALPQHPKNLFNSFSLNTRARNKYDDLQNAKSTDTFVLSNSDGEDPKREIFISIETEQNDLDKSPISPNSIRNMVGNPQTVVEVELDSAHDNKFSKISDDDIDCAENSEVLKPSVPRSTNFPGHLPNVQLNNAKNLMQQMQEDFRQMGEEMNASIRQTIEHRTPQPDMHLNSSPKAASRSIRKVNKSVGTPSGDAYADSDELSSLDGYPLSSPNSRLGVSSKTSADSAYGSLSRQRSSELTSQRSSNRNRPITSSSTANTLLNRPLTEESSLGRSRQLSASSSSSSEHALPPIVANNNFTKHQQQQQQQHLYNNNNIATDFSDMMHYERNNNYDVLNQPVYPSTSAGTAITNSHSNLESSSQLYSSNSNMSTSMKLSRFCHECGSKFLVEQAKFCMDCGVKRIVL